MIKKTITQNNYVERARRCLNTGAWRRAMHFLNRADVEYPNPLNLKYMKTNELEEIIAKKYKKYNSLLWYARSSPEHINIKGVKEGKEKIEREFTEEVAALKGDHSDWEHGFHSGCCAAFSYVLTCLDKDMGVEVAEEEFPMLDS